jgi:geranyl-CoA carboxylase alpha subunit|tara:strand:- start:95 stop:622 length:528 start_codon:yes stop_codon:yes gene_type:complete
MDWSIDGDDKTWSVRLRSEKNNLFVDRLQAEDVEVDQDFSINYDESRGSIIIESLGRMYCADVTKVGDAWWVSLEGKTHIVRERSQDSTSSDMSEGGLTAPMPGTVREVLVKTGQRVREGQPMMILEAMKMEHQISAPQPGEVSSIYFKEGDRVDMGEILISITTQDSSKPSDSD